MDKHKETVRLNPMTADPIDRTESLMWFIRRIYYESSAPTNSPHTKLADIAQLAFNAIKDNDK